jgi:pimeloyl-[acyl-carrier protein] synthase
MSSLAASLDVELSLVQLLDPAVMANPYPLYENLRERDPVHWDPFLRAWVVTRYTDALAVLHRFSADRAPSPESLIALGCAALSPIAQVMTKQMMFLDGAAHARLRSLTAAAFSPRRVQALRESIQVIADRLVDRLKGHERADLVADFAEPLPALVTAEILGTPEADYKQLKVWSSDFGKMLGSIDHAAEFAPQIVRSLNDAVAYFSDAIRELKKTPREGLVQSLFTAEADGARLTEEEIVANCILIIAGSQEDVTNLIGNGMLTLLRHPETIGRLASDASLIPLAVEELLRYEGPTQHTTRVAPDDIMLGGKLIRKRQQVIVLLAAANRDPEKFTDAQQLDLARKENRHLAFGWAAHFCLGATLARAEAQIAIDTLSRRLVNPALESASPDWRVNLSMRGLRSLPVRFDAVVPGKEFQLASV